MSILNVMMGLSFPPYAPASELKPEPEYLSQCCGAGEHEYAENFCAACGEATGFECSICGKERSECECE